MGVSIMGGFITTLGSGIFLITCQISFFYKFGEIIAFTVAFAFIISVFVFSAMMKAFGPEGNCGNIYFFLKKEDKVADET